MSTAQGPVTNTSLQRRFRIVLAVACPLLLFIPPLVAAARNSDVTNALAFSLPASSALNIGHQLFFRWNFVIQQIKVLPIGIQMLMGQLFVSVWLTGTGAAIWLTWAGIHVFGDLLLFLIALFGQLWLRAVFLKLQFNTKDVHDRLGDIQVKLVQLFALAMCGVLLAVGPGLSFISMLMLFALLSLVEQCGYTCEEWRHS